MSFIKNLFTNRKGKKINSDNHNLASLANAENFGSSANIMPFLGRVDASDIEANSFLFNPAGDRKLLKKVSDDLVSLFVLVKDNNSPITINKHFMEQYGLTPDIVYTYAEQNIVRLYNEKGKTLKKEISFNSTLYTIVTDQKTEAATIISKNIWDTIRKEMNDEVFVSIPTANEINYCKLNGNSLCDLIQKTNDSYNKAGQNQLSPCIYLFHKSSWIMFDKGMEQIFDFCVENNLITLDV